MMKGTLRAVGLNELLGATLRLSASYHQRETLFSLITALRYMATMIKINPKTARSIVKRWILGGTSKLTSKFFPTFLFMRDASIPHNIAPD